MRSRTVWLSPAAFRVEASNAVILLMGGFSNLTFFSSEGSKLSALFFSFLSHTEILIFLSAIFVVNLLL